MILELQRAAQAVLIRLADELEGLSMLSPHELNALANLGAEGSAMSAQALGAALGGRPGTLTNVLERLAWRDLITQDDATTVVSLTPAGTAAAELVLTAIRDLEHRAFAGLPEEKTQNAAAVLLALTKAAKQ